MRARHRHFKPRSVGASLGLDARFISGLSNGSAVSTWSDLSANANDASQATGANQPVYTTNVSGGAPGVKFDGSNDNMRCASYIGLTQLTYIVAVNMVSANTTSRHIFHQGNYETYTPNYNSWALSKGGASNTFEVGNYNNPNSGGVRGTTTIPLGSQQVTGIINDSGVTRIIYNGIQEGTNTSVTISMNTGTRPTLGKAGEGNVAYFDGYILSILLTSTVLNSALRRKIEHANAYSFKFASS